MAARRHRLAERRKNLGFTQEGLAERLGVDPTTVRRWESGETEGGPKPWIRPKLAQYLQVSPAQLEELLGEEPDESLSALNVDEQHHVEAALSDARRYFDGPVVDYFRRQLDVCMMSDGEQGSTATLPAVLGLLGAVEQHGREIQPAVRRELLSFGACGAEFVGWLYRDANDPAQARFWYDRATEWAQEAGDLPMQGYVLLKKSQMAYDARDALRVFTLAQAALEGPWQLPTRVRAEVTQQEALGMAMVGEPLPAVERMLDGASQLLARAVADSERPGLPGAYFTDTTLILRNAATFTEAGKPSRAAVVFGEVLANAGLSRRDAGFFRARRAAALALSGEPDEAATVGLESVEVATATSSRRTLRVLTEVMSTLTPWRGRPLVRELHDAMAASGNSSTTSS
jgi:transcriptional regulator with XRE-family HTH domain